MTQLTDLDLGEFEFPEPYGVVTAQAETNYFKTHKYVQYPRLYVLNNDPLELPNSLPGWFGSKVVTLVDPQVLGTNQQLAARHRFQWHIGFHYATIGPQNTNKDDAVVDSVRFGLTDLKYIFDDHDTHGLMSISDSGKLVGPHDSEFNMNKLVGATIREEVFRADTAIGTVVGAQGPITVDAFTHRNEQSLEIEFEFSITVTEAIRRAKTVYRFFAALVGRSQNIEWMATRISTDDDDEYYRIILGRNYIETFDTSSYGGINHLDVLIHSVRHRRELEDVLSNWVEREINDERRAESRRVMHRNYGNVFSHGRLYDALRIPEWVIPNPQGRRDEGRIDVVRKHCSDLDSDDLRDLVGLARKLRNYYSHSEDVGRTTELSSEDAKKLEEIGGPVFLTQVMETVNGLADLFECGYDSSMLHEVSSHPFRRCIRNFEHYVRRVADVNLDIMRNPPWRRQQRN
ncbi:MAG: hypothetical protein OXH99_13615 [Bryobacterales bacterium]|nr:hypothetical protein [Bryobacterales bacterium]